MLGLGYVSMSLRIERLHGCGLREGSEREARQGGCSSALAPSDDHKAPKMPLEYASLTKSRLFTTQGRTFGGRQHVC